MKFYITYCNDCSDYNPVVKIPRLNSLEELHRSIDGQTECV